MAGQGFEITVTSSEINVRQDGSLQSGGSRGASGVGFLFAAAFLFVFTVIIDKHGRPGLWYDIQKTSRGSLWFCLLSLLLLCILVSCGYLVLIGIRLFFPAGEELVCDRNTFTYSKVPWVSLRGRWLRRSFAVTDISELMYGVVISGDAEKKTEDQYGLSFYAHDREYKILAGLEAADADEIVKKLRSFGADVIINQDMGAMMEKKL